MTTQVAISSNPPGMFASLDALLAASTSHCSEMAVVNAARMVVSLKAHVLQQDPRLSSLSAPQCCAMLLLYNSSLARLAMTMHCPQMLELAVAVPLTACPQLRSVLSFFPSFSLSFSLSFQLSFFLPFFLLSFLPFFLFLHLLLSCMCQHNLTCKANSCTQGL